MQELWCHRTWPQVGLKDDEGLNASNKSRPQRLRDGITYLTRRGLLSHHTISTSTQLKRLKGLLLDCIHFLRRPTRQLRWSQGFRQTKISLMPSPRRERKRLPESTAPSKASLCRSKDAEPAVRL